MYHNHLVLHPVPISFPTIIVAFQLPHHPLIVRGLTAELTYEERMLRELGLPRTAKIMTGVPTGTGWSTT